MPVIGSDTAGFDIYRVLAQDLFEAWRSGVPCAPPTDRHPMMTAADGYRIQRELIALRCGRGDHAVGYKIGLTSAAMRASLGVDAPDYGPVLASATYDSGAELPMEAFIAPRVEAEIALVLDSDVTGPGLTERDIHRAAAGVVATLEVVDSRIVDWRLRLPDTIADLASFGAAVLSNRLIGLDRVDLPTVGVCMTINGRVCATGAGAATMGHPLRAATWLANTLGDYGISIPAGHFIMTGALHAAVGLGAGDTVSAEFDALGRVGMATTRKVNHDGKR